MAKMSDAVFLTHVKLRNYKSIAQCSIELGPLSFLVGPNGAGKSNFLDALRLVAESLNTSLDNALRERGGIGEVRRRSAGHPTHFSIQLDFQLPDGRKGAYGFQIGSARNVGFMVREEACRILDPDGASGAVFRIVEGKIKDSSERVNPPASKDRLYLVAAAGLPPFRALYDALSRMGFYNFNPDAIRELQSSDPGQVLRRDGSNLASVLNLMQKENNDSYLRVVAFLSRVVPGVDGVSAKQLGKKETLEFRQRVVEGGASWRFMAENMSDGTLRALGVLTSLFQSANGNRSHVPLVGIEEPEVAVHPGAAGVLRDALTSASAATQVLVTSHSPDLLDDKDIGPELILGVTSVNGETRIGSLDEAGRTAIKDRLFTAGELLRQNQLMPEKEKKVAQDKDQHDLFGESPE
jgi:predicted ATPase